MKLQPTGRNRQSQQPIAAVTGRGSHEGYTLEWISDAGVNIWAIQLDPWTAPKRLFHGTGCWYITKGQWPISTIPSEERVNLADHSFHGSIPCVRWYLPPKPKRQEGPAKIPVSRHTSVHCGQTSLKPLSFCQWRVGNKLNYIFSAGSQNRSKQDGKHYYYYCCYYYYCYYYYYVIY